MFFVMNKLRLKEQVTV